MWSVYGPRRIAVGLASASISGVALWMGCSVYDKSLLLDVEVVDAGEDHAVPPAADASDGSTDPCVHARWPPRPAADSPGSKGDVEFFAALRRLSIGASVDAGG